jgi:sugar lactone lactonase YvrE
VDSEGNFYFADVNNGRIRKVSTAGIITTVAGNGDYGYNGDNIPALSAKLSTLGGVAVDSAGDVYFVDAQNQRIRKVH